MSVDLASFYESFFDEAEELLQVMEQTLMDLDVENPDREDLNAIFRAVHSIKGGAATFGTFETLVQTAHKIENVLDAIRNNEIPLTQQAQNLFLRSKDILSDQISVYRTHELPDETVANALIAELEQLRNPDQDQGNVQVADEPVAPVPELEMPAADSEEDKAEDTQGSEGVNRTFRIVFNGVKAADLATLRNELTLMGELTEVDVNDKQAIVNLYCDLDESVIRAVCGFVINDDQMQIEVIDKPDVPSVSKQQAEQPVHQSSSQSQQQTGAAPATAATASVHKTSVPQPAPATTKAAQSKDSGTIRVATTRVDILVNQVGEVVINQSILSQAVNKLDPIEHADLLQGFEQMAAALRSLQESIMALRMVPIDYAFGRYPRVVRETAAKLNKKIQLKTIGGGTELDKGLIEKMIDPLTHLIRNSMDHGIEKPEVRLAKGKPEVGTITVSAYQEGGRIVIAVADDGGGINREKVLAKAIERGMPVSPNMSDNEVFGLIFQPGFSTAEVVTDVSGRGVGMDVVRRNIQEVGGQIRIESKPGEGTTTYISLPLTLAIMDGMSLQVAEECFVMPLAQIAECLRPMPGQIHALSNGTHVLSLRGDHIPIVRLARFFGIRNAIEDISQCILVIAHVGSDRFAIAVDRLLGQHQVVIKSLETHYMKVRGTSGATILGDGSVALILDAAQLKEYF